MAETATPTRVTPKTAPSEAPERRAAPDWFCPDQGDSTIKRLV